MPGVRRRGAKPPRWGAVFGTLSAFNFFGLSRQDPRSHLQGLTSSNFRLHQYNVHMLRLAVRKFVPKPQPLNQFTCKPGYHSFYIVLLTRGEDKHGVTG